MPTRSLMRQVATGTGAAPRTISSRHFLKLIEETGTVGFWSADLRAERLDASPGLSRIFGLDPASELTFAVCLDMIHPEDQPAHRDQIAVLRSGQPINREFRIVRPDRTQRWVQHRAEVILGQDGAPSQGMAGRPRYDLPAAASVASMSDAAASEPTDTEQLLTPGQIRAARGLTGLSKDELAALADVSVSTLNRLEDPVSAVRPRPDTLRAVRCALEAAGVAFTFEPGKKPGLREA